MNVTQEMKRIELNCEKHHEMHRIYRVAQKLICLKYSKQNEDSIRQALQNLKDSFVEGRL